MTEDDRIRELVRHTRTVFWIGVTLASLAMGGALASMARMGYL